MVVRGGLLRRMLTPLRSLLMIDARIERRRKQRLKSDQIELLYRLDEARNAVARDRGLWLRERDRMALQLDELRRRLAYLEELMFRRSTDERLKHAASKAREAAASGFGELR